jgi:tetratricopeptide (TPR) repeat protein
LFIALQKNAAPLDAATTSSLEALKSFSAGSQQMYVSPADALLLFKRATEIDPEFAMAHAYLGRAYADYGEQKLAAESIRQGYLLRGMVSDKENYFITYNYNRDVLRNLEICRQICESWIAKYPREVTPHGFLSGLTSQGTGQYEKAVEEGQKAIALAPDFTIGYENIGEAYLLLNRPTEAKAILQRATQRKLASKDKFGVKFFAAFLERDRSAMDKAGAQIATASPHGDSEHFKSLVAAYEGRLQQSRQASMQAVTLARQAHLLERAALFEGAAAMREALYGYPNESLRHAGAAGQLVQGRDVDFPRAFALALLRNSPAALSLVTQLEKEW